MNAEERPKVRRTKVRSSIRACGDTSAYRLDCGRRKHCIELLPFPSGVLRSKISVFYKRPMDDNDNPSSSTPCLKVLFLPFHRIGRPFTQFIQGRARRLGSSKARLIKSPKGENGQFSHVKVSFHPSRMLHSEV